MQNVKHLRVLRALLVAFAILFAINISAPVAQAAPVDASQQTVVSTDNSLDNRIKGDPEGGKKDIEMANTYLPVLRWNGLTGNYHSRYSSDAWDRGDAESSGLSTMARSIMQFGDALWSFTATTVNLSSSVDVYGTIGNKIDGVLARIGKAMFNGGVGASSSVVAILIGANVIYAFNKSRKSGGYAPLKDLFFKVCVTGFIAFLVFGAAVGGSPSKKIVGGVVSVVDKLGTSVASTADDTLAAVNSGEQDRAETEREAQLKGIKQSLSKLGSKTQGPVGEVLKGAGSSGSKGSAGGCDDYVKTLHRQYKSSTDLKASGNSSIIIDSLSKIWESSAIPVWQNIQFRTLPGPTNEQIDISNTWCHTAESLTQQSAARQAYTFGYSSNKPNTAGRAGWYAFAAGVAGGSKNRDQAIMFWTACRNSGSTWKMDPQAKLLLKDSSKGDQACQDFWDGSKKDKNLDPNANTPAKTVKNAMADAWTTSLSEANGTSERNVIRGAKSFDDWCEHKRNRKDEGNNLEDEANFQARVAKNFLKNIGVDHLNGLTGKETLNEKNLRYYIGVDGTTRREYQAKLYVDALKQKNPDLDEKKALDNMTEVLNRIYHDDTVSKVSFSDAQPGFCEIRSLNPDNGDDSTADSLTTDNPNGGPFDWSPSDGSALSKLVDQGSAGESAASFIQSVQNPTWGAGIYGIAVLYLLSSAIVFAIFTAMGVSILIAKTALMLMTFALGLMLIPAIVPGVHTGEKVKKVFITLVGFSGVAAVMMLAVSVVTIISKVMVDVGVGILPANSSFSVLWAGIAPGAAIVGLNMLLKKIGMPSPLSIKGALSWGSNGGSMLKGAMAGAAAAKAASAGRSLASRAGSGIERAGSRMGRRKAAQDARNREKGSKNAEPEPLPAKNSQAAWDKKSAVGRGIARAKTGVRNTAMSGYNRFVANTKLGKKVAWANNAFASEWNATKGQRGVFRAGAGVKAWTGSMMASRGGTAAQVKHLSNVASARQSKQTMPTPLKAASPASPTVGDAAASAPVLPSPSSGGGHAPRHSGGSAPSLPNITGGGSSSKPAAPATRYRGSAPSRHPATVTPKHP